MSGQLVGTPEYMSPEQIRNQPVTRMSDIYALGLVMFEMLSGQRPGAGKGLMEEVLDRIVEQPPRLKALRPDAPNVWDRLIGRCLQRDPDDRLPSAEIAAETLHRGSLPFSAQWSRREMWRIAGRAGGVAAAASIAGGAYWFFKPVSVAAGPKPLVVLTPVRGADPLTEGPIRVLLQRQLEQSASLQVWNQQTGYKQAAVEAGLPDNPTDLLADQWLMLARHVKAQWLVYPALRAGGTLETAVERVADQSRQAQAFAIADRRDVSGAVSDAARWVRRQVGESAQSIAANDRPANLVTTASPEALMLFEQAETIRDERPTEAISLLTQALKADPAFALAWMRLGDLQVVTYDWSNGLPNWRKAVELSESGRLSLREGLRIKTMYAVEIGDLPGSEAAALAWSAAFPDEIRPLWEIYHTRELMGRFPEAEKMIVVMSQKADSRRFSCLAETLSAMWNADTDRMERFAMQLKEAGSFFQGQRFISCAQAMRGDFAKAVPSGLELLNSKRGEEVSRGHVFIAALHAAQGDFAAARKYLNDGLDLDQKKGYEKLSATKHLGLAYLGWLDGNWAEVKLRAELAMMRGDPVSMVPACVSLLYRAGQVEEAARSGEEWDRKLPRDVPVFEISREWMRGEELLAAGDPNGLTSLKKMANLIHRTKAPEPLLYGLAKSGQAGLAKELAVSLMRHPGPLWYSPEVTAVGMIYYCRRLAEN